MNRPVRRAALLTALASVLVLLAAACGGGDGGGGVEGGSEPDAYAADVCGAITNWQERLQSSASTLGSDLQNSSDISAVKGKLVEFMGEAVQSTDQMLNQVEEAGPPDIEQGEAFHRDLVAGLRQARDTFAEAETNAENLPTNNPTAFQQGATELGQTLERQGGEIENTLSEVDEKYDSDELDKAFEDDPACKNL